MKILLILSISLLQLTVLAQHSITGSPVLTPTGTKVFQITLNGGKYENVFVPMNVVNSITQLQGKPMDITFSEDYSEVISVAENIPIVEEKHGLLAEGIMFYIKFALCTLVVLAILSKLTGANLITSTPPDKMPWY